MKSFYRLLAIVLIVGTANNFVWFALTYWAFLSTKSVISTSTMAGIFLVVAAVTGLWFGSLIDHNKKKHVMIGASVATLALFSVGLAYFSANPEAAFTSVANPQLWVFIILLLAGVIVGAIYNIAIPTLIGLIVPEDRRAQANGMFGMITGIAFGITSVASGISLAYGGMPFVLRIAIAANALVIVALALMRIPEDRVMASADGKKDRKMDIRGTIRAVRSIPGLFPLIFFTTFNNFLGGVFFSLMDAYGLTLVSVQTWGLLWGLLSFGFIFSGMYISKKGLGKRPLHNLFRVNIINWMVCIFFAIQPSIVLLMIGTFIWMFLFPFIEATEQTIFQKVVPPERLGRVFGFAHSIEQSASPITAFLIGPIAQFAFIPFMTTGRGVELIGGWFGTGPGRGIALVFMFAGALGLIVTLIAMRSQSFKTLADRFGKKADANEKSAPNGAL